MRIRKFAAAAAALLALLLPVGALANSGPVRWEGYAHGEMLAVEENCPIEVQHEELVFDLRQGTQGRYTIGGTITATYTMRNPTDTARRVEMAFPLIAELSRFSPAEAHVRVDGQPVETALYIGEQYSSDAQSSDGNALPDYSFARILAALQPEGYTPVRFDPAQEAVIYTFRATRKTAQDINLTILFPDAAGAYFLGGRSIRGYGQQGDDIHFLFSAGEEEAWAEVLVIGDAPAPTISGALLGDSQQPTDAYTCDEWVRTESLEDYFGAYCAREAQLQLPDGYLGNTQAMDTLYNLLLRRLDEGLGREFQVLNDALETTFTSSYLLVLQYAAEFPAQSTLEVQISYPVSSAMERRNSGELLYPFTYLFSPAAHWAGFGGLAITIKAPEEASEFFDSSLPFTQDSPGVYSTRASTLPESPLTFTLRGSEVGAGQGADSLAEGGNIRALAAGILGVGVLCIGSVVVLHRRGKKRDEA